MKIEMSPKIVSEEAMGCNEQHAGNAVEVDEREISTEHDVID